MKKEELKSFEQILKEGNEGHPFREVIVGLDDDQIIESAKAYAAQAVRYALSEAANEALVGFAQASRAPQGEGDYYVSKDSILSLEEQILKDLQ